MNNYKLYVSSDNAFDCIATLMNEGIEELYRAQANLTSKGYIITGVNGMYIHCVKAIEPEDKAPAQPEEQEGK